MITEADVLDLLSTFSETLRTPKPSASGVAAWLSVLVANGISGDEARDAAFTLIGERSAGHPLAPAPADIIRIVREKRAVAPAVAPTPSKGDVPFADGMRTLLGFIEDRMRRDGKPIPQRRAVAS